MEIYVSVDVESDGPIPGPNSMLSFGAAAYSYAGTLIDTFEVNLETLDFAIADPDTMKWWATQKEAWEYCRKDQKQASIAMKAFEDWTKGLISQGHKPVMVCYPAGYDFTFMYWYMRRFTGRSLYGFQALDIKSYAMAKLGEDFKKTVKKNFPKRWLSAHPHTHKALDDAIEQGEMFIKILWDGE